MESDSPADAGGRETTEETPMPLSFEDEQARLEHAADARERNAVLFAAALTKPAVDDEHPLRRAATDARAHLHATKTRHQDEDDELSDLLAGGGDHQDDTARLARVQVLRRRQTARPAELAAAEDALALAESRLQPVLDAEQAAQSAGIEQAARKAERDLNEKRKRLSLEYHQLAARMAEIDRELKDPTEQARVIAQLRQAGL
jgi:hypothetical protein